MGENDNWCFCPVGFFVAQVNPAVCLLLALVVPDPVLLRGRACEPGLARGEGMKKRDQGMVSPGGCGVLT